MKDIVTIIVRLTLSCLLAATVMGVCFVFTSKAKKHNEHRKEQQVSYSLLGFSGEEKPGDSLALHELYRYVISGGGQQSIGYLVPQGQGALATFLLVNIDLNGQLIEARELELSPEEGLAEDARNRVVGQSLGAGYSVKFADRTTVVTDSGSRIAYLLGGKFQGFKTFIKVMLAVDPDFGLLGLEILEHEEDPGLGAEIEQDYFKNQFKGKPFAALKRVAVVKEPIPADYLQALTGRVGGEEILKLQEQYKDGDIYALTGATITTRAVSNGVKNIVKKFAYRISVLDRVLREQQLAVPF